MAGAYLSVLARANRYKATALRMRTVAERTGLWAVYGKDKGAVEDQLGALSVSCARPASSKT
jgi:hypothetical protein